MGRQGRLDLTLTSRRGRTEIADTYCEVPFKITRLHDPGTLGIPRLILMHCTAGLFGGDRLECTIHVERGARVLITQQSATKVHPSGGRPAIQRNQIRVDSGGELHLYYDPVIPFSGSRLHQSTLIEVEDGARLCFWEGFMAGRVGRGELWEFDELSSETALRQAGRRLYLERFMLRPKQYPLTGDWTMGAFRYFGSFLYFGKDASDFSERFHHLLPEIAVDTPAAELAVSRVLAFEGQDFHRIREVTLAAGLIR